MIRGVLPRIATTREVEPMTDDLEVVDEEIIPDMAEPLPDEVPVKTDVVPEEEPVEEPPKEEPPTP